MNEKKVIEKLNKILECELSGVVKYTHYSLMVFGHNRIPIVKWLREQATESLVHAGAAGEHITALGGYPSLKIGSLIETQKHALNDILKESLQHEEAQIKNLYELLKLVEDKSIYLEEYTRMMITEEETHVAEVRKMIRTQSK